MHFWRAKIIFQRIKYMITLIRTSAFGSKLRVTICRLQLTILMKKENKRSEVSSHKQGQTLPIAYNTEDRISSEI